MEPLDVAKTDAKSARPHMLKVGHWKQVGDHRGSLVVYATKSVSINAENSYVVPSDPTLKFGLIADEPKEQSAIPGHHFSCYEVKRLIQAGNKAEICFLASHTLPNDLRMRSVSADELAQIREAIETDRAQFEQISKADALAKLDRMKLNPLESPDGEQPRCWGCSIQ